MWTGPVDKVSSSQLSSYQVKSSCQPTSGQESLDKDELSQIKSDHWTQVMSDLLKSVHVSYDKGQVNKGNEGQWVSREKQVKIKAKP